MKRVLIASLAAWMFLATPVAAADVGDQGSDQVAVRSVVIKNDSVTGMVVNNSDVLVRNPRILIRHEWLWADEFEPGQESPGRSEVVTIPAEIQPGDSFTFTHPFPVTEVGGQRGRFQTSAEVVGFEQVGRQSISRLH